MLNYPCINGHSLTLEAFMDMIKVWAFFFEGERLSLLVLAVFFSEKTIRNTNPTVVQLTCKILNRSIV